MNAHYPNGRIQVIFRQVWGYPTPYRKQVFPLHSMCRIADLHTDKVSGKARFTGMLHFLYHDTRV